MELATTTSTTTITKTTNTTTATAAAGAAKTTTAAAATTKTTTAAAIAMTEKSPAAHESRQHRASSPSDGEQQQQQHRQQQTTTTPAKPTTTTAAAATTMNRSESIESLSSCSTPTTAAATANGGKVVVNSTSSQSCGQGGGGSVASPAPAPPAPVLANVPVQHESATGKPAVPVHCIVELSSGGAGPTGGGSWRDSPAPTTGGVVAALSHVDSRVITDGYAIVPANTSLANLVPIALEKLGVYSDTAAPAAKGALQIKNWRPLSLDQVTDSPQNATVGEMLADLGQLVTLRIALLSLPSVKGEQSEDALTSCQTFKRETHTPPEELPEETKEPPRDLNPKDIVLLNHLLSKHQQQQQQQQQQEQQKPSQQLPQQQPHPPPHRQQMAEQNQTDRFANQLLIGAAALQSRLQMVEGLPPALSTGKATIPESAVTDSVYQSLLQTLASDKRGVSHGGVTATTAVNQGMFSPERREEILRTFIENAPKLSQTTLSATHPAGLAALPMGRKRQGDAEVLDFSVAAKLAHAPHSNGQLTRFDDDKLHASKPRVRTTFDPETEVPQLHAWFQRDQHPTRVQIQDYVEQLNAARRALNRDKLLNVNNVVYWFKNARAAYKRRRLQGVTPGQLTAGSLSVALVASSPDKGAPCSPGSTRDPDIESDHEGSVSPPPKLAISSQALPLNASALDTVSGTPGLLDKWKEYEYQRRLAEAQQQLGWHHLAAVMQATQAQQQQQQQQAASLDLSIKPPSGKHQSCSSEADNESGDSSKEGLPKDGVESDASDDDEPEREDPDPETEPDNEIGWENRIANAQQHASNLTLYGTGVYGGVALPGVQFQGLQSAGLSTNGHAAGGPLEAGRKRNRTFIDPVSEVPKLEKWFNEVTTHPHHAQIEEFTAELNAMEYRQKFPKLEPRNVQFWFKNRRAKYKRIEKSATSSGPSPSAETAVSS